MKTGIVVNGTLYYPKKIEDGVCGDDCALINLCQKWDSCPMQGKEAIFGDGNGMERYFFVKADNVKDKPLKKLIELTVTPEGDSNFKPYKALFSVNNIEEVAGHDIKFFNYATSIRVEEDYETIKQKIKDAE